MMLQTTTDIFKSVHALPVMTDAGEHPHLINVMWVLHEASPHAVQIYVDGTLRDTATCKNQSSMWLALDRSRAHVISLLGVDPSQAFLEQSNELQSFEPVFVSHWSTSMLRDESLPADAVVHIELDGQTQHRRPLWESHIARSGFGSLFGVGDFGSDAITGPGLGYGALGHGPLGSDASPFVFKKRLEHDTTHTFTWSLKSPSGENLSPVYSTTLIADLPSAEPSDLQTDQARWFW